MEVDFRMDDSISQNTPIFSQESFESFEFDDLATDEKKAWGILVPPESGPTCELLNSHPLFEPLVTIGRANSCDIQLDFYGISQKVCLPFFLFSIFNCFSPARPQKKALPN